MSFTFIGSAEAEADATGTTLDCTSALNVAAGDLLIAWLKYEGANGTFAVAKSTGTPANTFTVDAGDEENHSNSDLNASFAYVLSAAADAAMVPRLTTSSRPYRGIIVFQLRPDAGKTVTKLAAANGQGTATSCTSGVISPAGDDIVTCGGYAQYANVALSAHRINGVDADGVEAAGTTDCSHWYRILTAGFTNGPATVTSSLSRDYICNVIAFGAEAAGGGGFIPAWARGRNVLLNTRAPK